MARTFNGSSDLIRADAARVVVKNQASSVAFWVNVPALANSTSPNFVCYAEADSTSTFSTFAIMSLSSSSLTNVRIFMKNSGNITLIDVMGTHTAWDGTWHHVIWTQAANNSYVTYVDGVQDITGSYSNTIGLTNNDLSLGALVRSTTTNFFPGKLAQVANWTRQLTAAEAKSLASGLPPSYLGPNHYWPLWGVDSPEPDIGNG